MPTASRRRVPGSPLWANAHCSSSFLLPGIGKITDPTTYLGYIQAFGVPFPAAALAGAIAIEILGGVALLAGYRARLTGAMMAAFSVTTALIFHADLGNTN